MFKNKKRLLLLGLSVLMLLPTGCSGSGKKEEEQLVSQELIVPEEANYKLTEVATGEYINTRTTSGSVGFSITSDLYWDKSDCRYQEVNVEKGSYVSEGDVLMKFTTDDSEIALEEKQLNLKRLQEDYSISRSDKQKEIATAKEGLAGLESYDYQIAQLQVNKLQTSYEQYCYETEYQIAQIQKEIEEIQEEMERNTITAPYDGIVEWVTTYTIGDKVPEYTTLISMYSTDKIAIKAENPGNVFAYNQEVTLTGRAQSLEVQLEGRIVSAANILPLELQSEYMVVQITSEIPEEVMELGIDLLGATVSISGNTEEIQNITIVDRKAVELEDGDYYVQLMEDGIVKKRFVTIGCANNNGNGSIVWIVDGVDEGDELALFK